jgi:hypothetical protein
VDRVVALERELQRVGLVELERVVRLWLDIHAHHLETSPVVAHGSAAGAAEEIQQPRFHDLSSMVWMAESSAVRSE